MGLRMVRGSYLSIEEANSMCKPADSCSFNFLNTIVFSVPRGVSSFPNTD